MKIVFMVRSTGKRVVRIFDSYYLGEKFLDKIKRSKKLALISWQEVPA